MIKERKPLHWTHREIILLEEHYPKLGASEVRRRFLPDRNSGDIYTMAQRLGLRKASSEPDSTADPAWTEEELVVLRTHYVVFSVVELQRHYLPRHNAEAIHQKARRLGFEVPRNISAVPWTTQELEVLQRHYVAMGAKALQREYLPHRTVKAIIHKAGKLGLKHQPGCSGSQHRQWADEELALLHRYYGTMPVPELQRRYFPERTPGALRRLATGLGLSRADYLKPWTEEEIALLERHFVQGGPSVAAKVLPYRSSTSIRSKARKLGLHCPKPVAGESWTDEELERLERLQHLPLPELLGHFPERSRHAVDSQRSRLRYRHR